MKPFLTTTQLAEELAVSSRTVLRWAKAGWIQPKYYTPGGWARFGPEQVAELRNLRQKPVRHGGNVREPADEMRRGTECEPGAEDFAFARRMRALRRTRRT